MPAHRKGFAAAKAAAAKKNCQIAVDPRGAQPRLPSTRINRGQHSRNLTNGKEQQTGRDDARIACLAEIQEEKARLRAEKDLEAQEEGERLQQNAKLLAALARVDQLKARKAEKDARQNATGLATLPATGVPQPQTIALATGVPQSSQAMLESISRQGESSLVSVELFKRYPAIDKIHFKAIKENTFKPINVVKLTINLVLERNKVKILAVGSDVAFEAREEDAVQGEVKGLSHLIRCFLIYMNILLHFTHQSMKESLQIGMLAYVEQLWSYSGSSTFESIRQYHFLFHFLRIQEGINDGALWGHGNTSLERKTLRLN